MSEPSEIDKIRQECWRKRFYSFGTTKIFEKRARSLELRRKLITFLGLAAPVLLGTFVAAYYTESRALKTVVLPVVGAITIIQAAASLWSLVARWDEKYAYAIGAIRSNTHLASAFEELAVSSEEKLMKKIDHLRDDYSQREIEDTAQGISTKEKRFAQRSSLFQYRSKCPTCNKVPISMKPENCDSCGNY